MTIVIFFVIRGEGGGREVEVDEGEKDEGMVNSGDHTRCLEDDDDNEGIELLEGEEIVARGVEGGGDGVVVLRLLYMDAAFPNPKLRNRMVKWDVGDRGGNLSLFNRVGLGWGILLLSPNLNPSQVFLIKPISICKLNGSGFTHPIRIDQVGYPSGR